MNSRRGALLVILLASCGAETSDSLFNSGGAGNNEQTASAAGGHDSSDGHDSGGTSAGSNTGGPDGTGDNCECALPNAKTVCIDDTCYLDECITGYSDCNGNPQDGCEVNSYSDTMNCGSCGNICAPIMTDAACVASNCSCLLSGNVCDCYGSAYADCDSSRANGCESHILSDPQNCGECGYECLNMAYCQSFDCQCSALPIYSQSELQTMQPCIGCIKSKCCDKLTACMNDSQCSQYWNSWATLKINGGGGCFGCGEPPILNSKWVNLRSCLQNVNCLSNCGG